MPGLSLFHPPIDPSKRPPLTTNGDTITRRTWTDYDDRQLSHDTFHIFPKLLPELQIHVWRSAASEWIFSQENAGSPCTLDNVVYADPLRIRLKLPGLPAVFQACSLSREVAYDSLRELCARENLKRVGPGVKAERFRDECRRTGLTVGRESVMHLQKTDGRGAKSTVTIKTHAWTQLRDFRLEKESGRKRSRERAAEALADNQGSGELLSDIALERRRSGSHQQRNIRSNGARTSF